MLERHIGRWYCRVCCQVPFTQKCLRIVISIPLLLLLYLMPRGIGCLLSQKSTKRPLLEETAGNLAPSYRRPIVVCICLHTLIEQLEPQGKTREQEAVCPRAVLIHRPPSNSAWLRRARRSAVGCLYCGFLACRGL
jgi:hypothetical protein